MYEPPHQHAASKSSLYLFDPHQRQVRRHLCFQVDKDLVSGPREHYEWGRGSHSWKERRQSWLVQLCIKPEEEEEEEEEEMGEQTAWKENRAVEDDTEERRDWWKQGRMEKGRRIKRRGWMRGKGRRGLTFHPSPQEICVWFKCKRESLFTGCLCGSVRKTLKHGQPVSKRFLFFFSMVLNV